MKGMERYGEGTEIGALIQAPCGAGRKRTGQEKARLAQPGSLTSALEPVKTDAIDAVKRLELTAYCAAP
jgi:hypothetical protein